jgi:iron(III) transport system substrate-binding protein
MATTKIGSAPMNPRSAMAASAASPTRRSLLSSAGAAAAVGMSALYPRPLEAQQTLLWYSASASKADEEWSQMFRGKTGIPVEFFRIGGVKLTERIEQEIRARQVRCSVMDISIPGLMSEWAKKGMLTQYDSPEAAHYPAELRLAGYWTPINALTLSIAYNADHIKAEDAPRTWEDLLDPKWKGKMCMSDALYSGAMVHGFGALRATFGKGFMEKLARQDILIRNGSGETTDTIISGERPLAAMLLDYYVVEATQKGANLYLVQPEIGIPSSFEVIGMPAAAPDPELGRKFVDFALSLEAQQRWQDRHGTLSLRNDVTPNKAARGRRRLKDIKLLKSTVADLESSFNNQRALLDEWINLFK